MRTTAAKSTISDTAAGSLAPCMATYDAIAGLPLEIEGYELEAFERPVSSGFVRHTTVVRLRGGGEEGLGEDVTYEADEHERLPQRRHPRPDRRVDVPRLLGARRLARPLSRRPAGGSCEAELPAVGVRERGARSGACGRPGRRSPMLSAGRPRLCASSSRGACPSLPPSSRCGRSSTSIRPRGSSSIPRASGRRRSSPSWPSSTRSRCSTSRARTAGRPSTSRPIRGSTGSSPRRSRRRCSKTPISSTRVPPRRSSPITNASAGTRSSIRSAEIDGAPVPAALAQHQAVEVRQLLGALRHVRLLRGPRHHDVRRRAVRALRGARADPDARIALPRGRAERRRPARLRRRDRRARNAGEPAAAEWLNHQGFARRSTLHTAATRRTV